MSINPDEIVEGKCYRALTKKGATIFKVTEIKTTAVNAPSPAQVRRIVFWVSRSAIKSGAWTKYLKLAL